MKEKSDNILLNYLICFTTICCSGVIQFSYIWYKESIIVLFTISVLLFLVKNKKINKKNLTKLIILMFVLILNFLIYSNNIDGHLGLFMKIVSMCLLIKNIDIELFKKCYINIIFIISLISILCYFLFLIFPNFIISHVPIVNYWEHSTRYCLIYNFPGNGWEYGTLRNFGPFHEGGMFAAFIDIALLFAFNDKNLGKKHIIKIIVLIIALVLTFSTTGMIGLFLILFFYLFKRKRKREILTFIIAILAFVVIESNFNIIQNKISNTNASFVARTSEFDLFLSNYFNHPILGIGYQNNSIIEKSNLQNGTNGILSLFLQFGLIGGGLYLSLIILSLLKNSKGITEFLLNTSLYILLCSLEPLIFQPLFILIIFIDKPKLKLTNKDE